MKKNENNVFTKQYWHLKESTDQERGAEDDVQSLECDGDLEPGFVGAYFVELGVDGVEYGGWDEEDSCD